MQYKFGQQKHTVGRARIQQIKSNISNINDVLANKLFNNIWEWDESLLLLLFTGSRSH